MQPLGTVADAPAGQQPVGDSRFETTDIRLSSALCALGFSLRTDSQPVLAKIDADTTRTTVKFFHQDSTTLGDFNARHVDLWWNSPAGKYTIVGYDDALTAMRRVHIERAKMINLAKHGPKYRSTRNMAVATQSLHSASVLSACDIPLVGYDPSSRQWIFEKGAEIVCDLIKAGGRPKERPLTVDLCVDWMLEALKYRDWLAKLVRDPECIPMIRFQDGEKVLEISRDMPEKEQKKWTSYL
jgi:hypothetical protein